MRRIALFIALTALCNSTLFAHIDHNSYESQEVIVKTQKLTDNIYLLQGRGGNIAALTGMEGMAVTKDGRSLLYKRTFAFGNNGFIEFPVSAYPILKQLFEAFNKADVHQLTLRQGTIASATTTNQ